MSIFRDKALKRFQQMANLGEHVAVMRRLPKCDFIERSRLLVRGNAQIRVRETIADLNSARLRIQTASDDRETDICLPSDQLSDSAPERPGRDGPCSDDT